MGKMNDQDEARDLFPASTHSGRANSPSIGGLRQRPLGRASTFAESLNAAPRFARRSSSFVSETLSESRRSFRSSTDDLFLPRVTADLDTSLESSHWHSLPLGLALLPAVGGLFFKNGSAFITDISLLGLAALFLNWAVRLPWDWYLSAQAVVSENEFHELGEAINDDVSEAETPRATSPDGIRQPVRDRSQTALSELRIHELLALAACFIFPALGAYLLHAIRSQLSRPSEGLVSDYNLTIFILAAEVRPLSHLIKLVQRRTLFLQRTISASAMPKTPDHQIDSRILEMAQRVNELEAHISNSVLLSANIRPSIDSKVDPTATASPTSPTSTITAEDLMQKAANLSTTEIRKTMQPELDALNRAMRRYEKRFTLSATQIESRLQELEARMQDTIILAAATQRNANRQAGKYTPVLMNWVAACVVVPVRWAVWGITLPGRALSLGKTYVAAKIGFAANGGSANAKGKDGKGSSGAASSRTASSRKRSVEKGKAVASAAGT